ncbi:MAG TPA: PKD domain-containing protein, partial [Puia sp.]
MSRPLSILLFLSVIVCLPAFAQIRVDFVPDKTGGCSPLVIHFSNISSASASATYLWDFGNGNTATVRNPQAVYTDVGNYTVTLTVNDGGNSGSVSHTITVYDKPKPSITPGPTTVCGPQPITFTGGGTAGSGTITSWLWDFGDGTTQQTNNTTAQHIYPQSVTLPVSLTATNSYGCTDTVKQSIQVTVLTPATANFQANKRVLCLVTDPVQFTNYSTGPAPLTYVWDFGDATFSNAQDPGHSYSQKGTYTITLKTTAANGCTATTSMTNLLNVANYTTDFDVSTPTICQNGSIIFSDRSSPQPDNRVWLIDGNPIYYSSYIQPTFTVAGAHTIQLNNTYGSCPQAAGKSITV